MKVLWLASWYPNPYGPFNGDFIQRHAESVSNFLPVDVIHVLQLGSNTKIENAQIIINKKNNLTEYIHIFPFHSCGITFIDKVRYNFIYKRYYKRVIKEYFQKNGKPPLIHVHVPMKAGMLALYALKKFNIPYIVSEQASHYETAAPDNFFKRSRFFRRNTKKIFQSAAAVTNVSETIGKKLQDFFDIKDVKTIYNLVNTSLFFYQPKNETNKFRFIHVSSLTDQKNPKGIIRALALFKNCRTDWECVICGPASEELIMFTEEIGLKNEIRFTGEISYSHVADEMKKADAFILFSNHENLPCVIIEALCCGLPVISTNVGGIPEIINESNGILINNEDEDALCNAMKLLYSNYKSYNRMAIAKNAQEKFSYTTVSKQITEVYSKIIFSNSETQVK